VNGNQFIFDSLPALSEAVAVEWQKISDAAIKAHGIFRVALAGGGTPRSLYECLAAPEINKNIDWGHTQIYFGDERCVPPDHADSNYRLANDSLLSKVPVSPDHIHPMFDPAFDAVENARRYNSLISDIDAFDLILLGIGEDGHTASLFPGTEILEETRKKVAAQYVEKLSAWRISITFPVINAARHVIILVAGENKAEVLAELATNNRAKLNYPIQRIDPTGKLDWYMDRSAAKLLPEIIKNRPI
jgi:6-phosphogluconolactonase